MYTNTPNFDRVEAQYQANADRINKIDSADSYVASLSRPITGEYIVMPNGTVEFIRADG